MFQDRCEADKSFFLLSSYIICLAHGCIIYFLLYKKKEEEMLEYKKELSKDHDSILKKVKVIHFDF